jgi:hypothetical protein
MTSIKDACLFLLLDEHRWEIVVVSLVLVFVLTLSHLASRFELAYCID